ncbi:MAG: alpha/beta hydrolase, partial [Atopobiaceae bacterium]|nr:alpha/beta hydrolase [Atopobiaceae bacterium]
QSMGGYVSQAFIDLYPGEAAGFVSVDSAPLKSRYYPRWEVVALRHTKGMYQAIPWKILKPWAVRGVAETPYGRTLMVAFIDRYDKDEYVELAAFGYRLLADAIEAERAYQIDCPTILICGEKDHAGDVIPFNRKWAAGENLELVWIAGAGHNSNTDKPDEVNRVIERLLARV